MGFREKSLRKHLLALGIPVDRWGNQGAKSVRHLMKELNTGECSLEGNLRIVHSVAVRVFHKDLELREICQVFNNGDIKIREHLWGGVNEKLRFNESPIEGVRRAFEEELCITDYRPRIRFLGEEVIVSKSISYPGFVTKNIQTRYRVKIPVRLFREDGYVEYQRDKSTYFDWLPVQ